MAKDTGGESQVGASWSQFRARLFRAVLLHISQSQCVCWPPCQCGYQDKVAPAIYASSSASSWVLTSAQESARVKAQVGHEALLRPSTGLQQRVLPSPFLALDHFRNENHRGRGRRGTVWSSFHNPTFPASLGAVSLLLCFLSPLAPFEDEGLPPTAPSLLYTYTETYIKRTFTLVNPI